MPYRWIKTATPDESRLELWPHRSLPRGEFVIFIAGTAALMAVPLVAVLGTPVLWGVLPFLALALGGLWVALAHSYRAAARREVLTLSPALTELQRTEENGQQKLWRGATYWMQISLREPGGPVPQYLTLSGAGREVELGAFLSPEERVRLAGELHSLQDRMRRNTGATTREPA